MTKPRHAAATPDRPKPTLPAGWGSSFSKPLFWPGIRLPASVASAAPSIASTGARWSPERRLTVEREYAAGTGLDDIVAKLNALPGVPVTKEQLSGVAGAWRLRRPGASAARDVPMPWSLDRCRVAAREYAAGTPLADIVAQINALPGPSLTAPRVVAWAQYSGIRRPLAQQRRPDSRRRSAVPPQDAPCQPR